MTLFLGDAAPHFRTPGLTNPLYAFDSVAGRYLMVGVCSLASPEDTRAAMAAARANESRFDDIRAACFVVLPGGDEWRDGLADQIGLRWLFDPTSDVAQKFDVKEGLRWFLLDPMMRIIGLSSRPDASELFELLGRLPEPDLHTGLPGMAPVLVVPRLFEPEFCTRLMDHYEAQGGEPSGFMREIDGVTKLIMDDRHKKRSDVMLEDEGLMAPARAMISRRLVPQIHKAFQFQVTRMERYLVARYDADTGGYFRPHRDNTTKGTAHRRFAVSINLNADFDGGDLRFPEFGSRTYRPPVGGAVVFSCSLLHEATPVTRGKRYAFLPFLYDEAAARIREENIGFLDPALGGDYAAQNATKAAESQAETATP